MKRNRGKTAQNNVIARNSENHTFPKKTGKTEYPQNQTEATKYEQI